MILALAVILTWKSAGLTGVNVQALLFDDGNLYAATDSGIFLRAGGSEWVALAAGSYDAIVANKGTLYAGGNGVFKSMDGGQHWTAINEGLPPSIDVSAIAVDNDSNLYLGSRAFGIFKSTDGGATWLEKPTGITAFIITVTTGADGIYAGTNRGVLKSVDGGNSWRQINDGITVPFSITSIAIDPPSTVFAASAFAGVFRSDDAGENWISASNGLASNWVSAIALQNRTTLYAGTPDHGVFRSTDGGRSWTGFSSALPANFIHALVMSPGGSQLYAATSTGVFLVDFAPRSRSVRGQAYSFHFFLRGVEKSYEAWKKLKTVGLTPTYNPSHGQLPRR